MDKNRQRDIQIDIMRALELMLIVLAHVSPPGIIFNLRVFDVPMMVFVSGMSFLASGKTNINVKDYVISRTRRMVVPLWFFLTLLFLIVYFFKIDALTNMLTPKKILYSYLMYSGIGYVWIIRIFLIIALLAPFYSFLARKMNNTQIILFITSVGFLSLILHYLTKNIAGVNVIFTEFIIPAISYGACFVFGYCFKRFSTKDYWLVISISVISIIIVEIVSLVVKGRIMAPQSFKYPPNSIYLFYAYFVISCIMIVLPNIKISSRYFIRVVVFISSNTMWLYFLHIPIVEYMRHSSAPDNFAIRWAMALLFPICFFIVQRFIVLRLAAKMTHKGTAKFIVQTFTG